MTSIEMPDWAKIEHDEKHIKCPKCKGWLTKTDKPTIWKCSECGLRTYERKIEGFWIRKTAENERIRKLDELGLQPGEMYFCTKCRVHHEAGSKIGYMHLDFSGAKEKLRVCQVPGCEQQLTGKQKKYGCKMNCSIFIQWKETCKKCGYHFGAKGDGYSTRKICFSCAEKEQGATLSDWEDLGLNATASESDVRRRVVHLKRKGLMTETLSESATRIFEFYEQSKRS